MVKKKLSLSFDEFFSAEVSINLGLIGRTNAIGRQLAIIPDQNLSIFT